MKNQNSFHEYKETLGLFFRTNNDVLNSKIIEKNQTFDRSNPNPAPPEVPPPPGSKK